MVKKFIGFFFTTLFLFPNISFGLDCNLPRNIKEKVICNDDALRKMNFNVETLFKEKSNTDEQKQQLISSYKIFFNYKTYECEDKKCLQNTYQNAIDWLEKGLEKEISENILEEQNKCPIKNISQDCEIYVYSQYDGKKMLKDVFLSDEQETFLSEVKIDREGKCVVLFLSAYEPVIWDIYKTPGTDLRAVVVGGYYPQMIRGIDEKVETINNPEKGCINEYYEDRKILDVVTELNIPSSSISQIKKPIIGQELEKTAYLHNPNIYDGQYIQYTNEDLPPGKPGLEKLIREGKLRKATKQDIEKIKKVGGTFLTGTHPEEYRDHLNFFNAYIVLDKFEKIPAGLDGGLSISLFVPKDLSQTPKIDHTHSNAYRINANTTDVKNW